VTVGVAEAVGVPETVAVAEMVGVAVMVGVTDPVATAVGVAVPVVTTVGVAVPVATAVAVAVAAGVPVAVGAVVAVGVGLVGVPSVRSRCGWLAALFRELNPAASVEFGTRTNAKSPLPVIALVTSKESQVPFGTLVTVASAFPFGAVRVFQLRPVSDQAVLVVKMLGPPIEPLDVKSQSFAFVTFCVRPVIEKRIYVCSTGSPPPSTQSVLDVPKF